MSLHPSLPIPERILSIGDAGSGKTTNALNIARWLVRTKSQSRVYILDTDFAIPRMLTNYPEIVPIVKLYPCYDWTDYTKASKEILRLAKQTDWVVVDFIGSAWQAVQAYYAEQVFHQQLGNYFLEVRKQMDKDKHSLNALDGWTDWQVINPLYRQWINPLLFKGQYHIYATAKADQLSSDKKPTETSRVRQLFSRFGIKPQGQKDLPFQFHTLLINGYDQRTKARTITAVKDREREEVSGLPITNFAIDYLKNVAGWKL